MKEPVVGRLAPSPTGRLHLGHAHSFLLAWWSARAQGGRIVLRFEDLDTARVRPGAVDDALRDLEWLGLDWDGAPVLQSERTDAMRAAADGLLERGIAYPCTCSRQDIRRALSAPHADDGELRYPGTCRDARSDATTDVPAGVRLRVAPGTVRVDDAFVGAQEFDVAADVGDFLIARRDGVFAYQLAVVVDDHEQGVTEVVRADDLLSSTPRQKLLQAALGFANPRWLHVPLVVDAEGRRLSKRDGDLALTELRTAGVSGAAVARWVAETAGLPAASVERTSDGVTNFAWSAVPRDPVRLTRDALARIRADRRPSGA